MSLFQYSSDTVKYNTELLMFPLSDLHIGSIFYLPSMESCYQQCHVLGTHRVFIHDSAMQIPILPLHGISESSCYIKTSENMSAGESSFGTFLSPSSWQSGFVLDYQTVNDGSSAISIVFISRSAQAPHLSLERWQWATEQGVTLQGAADICLPERLGATHALLPFHSQPEA